MPCLVSSFILKSKYRFPKHCSPHKIQPTNDIHCSWFVMLCCGQMFHDHTLRPRQNVRHFLTAFSNAFPWIKIYECWFKCHWSWFLMVQSTIFQRLFGTKPLSEPMVVSLLTYICVTQPQWVNTSFRITWWAFGQQYQWSNPEEYERTHSNKPTKTAYL